MKKRQILKSAVVVVFLISLFGITNADLINITDPDGRTNGSSWYGPQEDNEVEPGMVANQYWDLEGFFMEDNELTMIGGFNFADGYKYGHHTYLGGDIFIDVDGDVDPLTGNGYDYVVLMEFEPSPRPNPSEGTYSVYSIDENAELGKVYHYNSPESDPYNYINGGTEIYSGLACSFESVTGDYIVNSETTLYGDGDYNDHYIVSGIDLSFLSKPDFYVHYTVECGNDNLMGSGSLALPEPGTFSLLAMGSLCLIGFWALRRKKDD